MDLNIKNYFLVILGEKDPNKVSQMVKRMQEKGKCVQIMDRTYSLIIESNEVVITSEIRKTVGGGDSLLLIVIRMDSDTNMAWCLKTQYSEYFKSVFNEINDR
jgi:hypothetical protein